MNGHDFRGGLFFYLGMMLIFLPFLRGHVFYLPLVFILVYLLKRFGEFSAQNAALAELREKAALFARRRRPLIGAAIVVLALVAPLGSSDYLLDVLVSALIYAILATALNITVGLTGVLVLGFIGFYAIGAYTTAMLTAKYAVCGFWVALPLAGLVAMLFGILLGIPTLRLKGDYLAIVTLGFGEIIKIFLNNLDSFTGGPNGILGIKRPELLFYTIDSNRDFYYFFLALLLLVVLVVARIGNSRYGRAWVAVRENEMAASALGINVFHKHLLSFSISAFFGGIAGALFAAKQGFISPDSFTFYESVLVLCMVVLGGLGNVVGSVLGAFLLVVVPEFLREFQIYRMLAFGAVMIAFMIFRPHGLLGSRTIALEYEDKRDANE